MASHLPNTSVGVVTKPSPRSVAATICRLQGLIDDEDLTLFAVIDHSDEANRVGLTMPDTKLVIFGSPTAGTPVMVAAPLAALDLPLKVLVWADGSQTKVSYTAPAELARRYALGPDLTARLAGIDALTDAVTASRP